MRSIWRAAVLALGGGVLALAGLATAATPVDDICKGARVRVQPGDVALRDKPQDRFLFFYGTGKQVGTLRNGEVVEVRDVAVIRTALGEQKWVLVRGRDGLGWIFVGTPGDADSCCVEAVKPLPRTGCK